jgi:hypothetical protein
LVPVAVAIAAPLQKKGAWRRWTAPPGASDTSPGDQLRKASSWDSLAKIIRSPYSDFTTIKQEEPAFAAPPLGLTTETSAPCGGAFQGQGTVCVRIANKTPSFSMATQLVTILWGIFPRSQYPMMFGCVPIAPKQAQASS